MRDIKFRAWDGAEKRYLKPIDTTSMVLRFLSGRVTDGGLNCPHIVLQQFTGLKDKNGAEIYEGDVVKSYNCKQPLKVIFRNACFCVKGEKGGISDIYDLAPVSSQALEVIGNIYENPESLG